MKYGCRVLLAIALIYNWQGHDFVIGKAVPGFSPDVAGSPGIHAENTNGFVGGVSTWGNSGGHQYVGMDPLSTGFTRDNGFLEDDDGHYIKKRILPYTEEFDYLGRGRGVVRDYPFVHSLGEVDKKMD